MDFIGDEEIRVNNNDFKAKTRCELFSEWVSKTMSKFSLLASNVKHIEARYDKSITNFFIFARFMFTFNLITCIGFSYLLINHLVNHTTNYWEAC